MVRPIGPHCRALYRTEVIQYGAAKTDWHTSLFQSEEQIV
jgi:hypothetical protein